MHLNRDQEQVLLNIAEWSVQSYLDEGKRKPLPENLHIDDDLKIHAGAFVTLYVKGRLRGCIGTFSESKPLFEVVGKLAVESATIDNRFKPVKKDELADLTIEISVLTPRRQVFDIDEIEIGKHGIYLVNGFRKGTLLPQVAVENGWDTVRFLEICSSNKMGLDRDAWKRSEIYIFQALIIR